MSDEEQIPVRVIDKREQRRQEAEARKQAEELAASEAGTTDHIIQLTELQEQVAEAEQSVLTQRRQDRIEELKTKGRDIATPLSEEEGQELLRLQAEEEAARQEEEANAGIPARTAFLVIMGHDGTATASSDCNQDVVIDREASIEDMYAGAAIVLRDIEASITAKHVVFGMQVSAQAMQEKAQALAAARAMQARGGGRRR